MNMFISDKVPEVVHHYLAEGYGLDEYDVFCGRGSLSSNHTGNQHYSSLIQSMLNRYVNARNKQHKMDIISEVIQQVRSLSPNGGFIKQDLENWRYFEIGDALAREKVSQTFRDAIRSQKNKTKSKSISASRKMRIDLTQGLNASKLSKQTSKSNLSNNLFKILNEGDSSLGHHENLCQTLCNTAFTEKYYKCCDLSNCYLSEIEPITFHNKPKLSCFIHNEVIVLKPDLTRSTSLIDRSIDIVDDDNTFFNFVSNYSDNFQWEDDNCYEPIPL